ncbi:hypothetical protein [uncultured Nostoc sp.]|nr:hypothetical protein [uncultured Nostoc sp.]
MASIKVGDMFELTIYISPLIRYEFLNPGNKEVNSISDRRT